MTYDNIEEFIENATREDIDMADKLVNLYEAGQITDRVWYATAKSDAVFKDAEDIVLMSLRQNPWQAGELIRDAEEFIVRELGDEFIGDYAAALYDCDEIYISAINQAASIYLQQPSCTKDELSLDESVSKALGLYEEASGGEATDADTLLADIMELADFDDSGIGYRVLAGYLGSKDKKSYADLFYTLTDMPFTDYVRLCVDRTNGKESSEP